MKSQSQSQRLCECGCGTMIPAFATNGKPRRYLQGHQNKKRVEIFMQPCECGCGEMIRSKDKKGRARRFVFGHHRPTKDAITNLQRHRGNRSGHVPWNRGKSYVIRARVDGTYANRGSWMMALKRLFPNRCMRCGWSDGPCDCHHLAARSEGGTNTIENGVILCPNCHRLVHIGAIEQAELVRIRSSARIQSDIVGGATCGIPQCDRPIYAKGRCQSHYQAHRRRASKQ